jgi:hypothetical protein
VTRRRDDLALPPGAVAASWCRARPPLELVSHRLRAAAVAGARHPAHAAGWPGARQAGSARCSQRGSATPTGRTHRRSTLSTPPRLVRSTCATSPGQRRGASSVRPSQDAESPEEFSHASLGLACRLRPRGPAVAGAHRGGRPVRHRPRATSAGRGALPEFDSPPGHHPRRTPVRPRPTRCSGRVRGRDRRPLRLGPHGVVWKRLDDRAGDDRGPATRPTSSPSATSPT